MSCCMPRTRIFAPRRPHRRPPRAFVFSVTAILLSALLLWFFVRSTDAFDVTPTQCQFILAEFRSTFTRDGDGYPTIENCDTRIVRLMWSQLIQRVYSEPGEPPISSYEALRTIPEKQFAKLVINAAAGALMDANERNSDDALIRIRVDEHGHFSRYVLHNSNRITALQTMLVISIATLAVNWWRIEKDISK
jgi:hypothetical protein